MLPDAVCCIVLSCCVLMNAVCCASAMVWQNMQQAARISV